MTTNQVKATELVRNGWLAYLGLYGAALERVKPQLDVLNEKTSGLFGNLVAKGEAVEASAQEVAGDVRARASNFYADKFSRVRSVLPGAGGDRVRTLEAEVEVLTKKVAALTKKTAAKKRAAKAA